MPRVKPERKVARRAEIVEAARTCFARNGFHRTTLQDIFAEAGLSAGCVYNYFQSKDELMLAVAEERHDLESRLIAKEGDILEPEAAFMAVAKAFAATYLDKSDESRRIALETWSESLRNPAVLASVRQGVHGPCAELVKLIKRGKAMGRFSADVDAEMAARTAIALLHGFILQKLWDAKPSSTAALATLERLLPSLLGYVR